MQQQQPPPPRASLVLPANRAASPAARRSSALQPSPSESSSPAAAAADGGGGGGGVLLSSGAVTGRDVHYWQLRVMRWAVDFCWQFRSSHPVGKWHFRLLRELERAASGRHVKQHLQADLQQPAQSQRRLGESDVIPQEQLQARQQELQQQIRQELAMRAAGRSVASRNRTRKLLMQQGRMQQRLGSQMVGSSDWPGAAPGRMPPVEQVLPNAVSTAAAAAATSAATSAAAAAGDRSGGMSHTSQASPPGCSTSATRNPPSSPPPPTNRQRQTGKASTALLRLRIRRNQWRAAAVWPEQWQLQTRPGGST
jgi:hypothetical protein